MRELVKRVLRLLLGNYAAYHIYAIDSRHEVAAQVPEGDSRIEAIDAVDLSASVHAQMRDQSGYCGADAQAFGCWCEGQLVACCIYWYGERYARHRNYWPLALGQAKLVQVITLDSMRGRGLAHGFLTQLWQRMPDQATPDTAFIGRHLSAAADEPIL